MHLRTSSALATLLLLLAASASPPISRASEEDPADTKTTAGAPSYSREVEPLIEHRCVVCHACYDAPCQLNLSSSEGTERGASKDRVYQGSRLRVMKPSRLGIDAKTTEEWRKRGFFSVLPGDTHPAGVPSLLLSMMNLGQASPFAKNVPIPDAVSLDISRKYSCPTASEFPKYAAKHPHGGMPYGTTRLAPDEYRTLTTWLEAGAPTEPSKAPSQSPELVRQVDSWEQFLNRSSIKERITARYLYEHLYLAHLTFRSDPGGPYFRIVRSTTAPGEPIDEIATRRPYDSPGKKPFWYRLQPIDGSIVHKTHIVYWLDDARMARYASLFLGSNWSPGKLPSYKPKVASNPFISFREMPAESRYRFLLDDAGYFIMTFIRGPVCRGQIAVDVIRDQFWVVFTDPDQDLAVNEPGFLDSVSKYLSMPAEHGSKLSLTPSLQDAGFDINQAAYNRALKKLYDKVDPEDKGQGMEAIWDGDGSNPNSRLTVMRNFDNAMVLEGFVGAFPKTVWRINFPIFERIYYSLVAGFDVFGTASHQVVTRLYMDHLRMQSEIEFLVLLPEDVRRPIRKSWYVGATDQVAYFAINNMRGIEHGTRIDFKTDDPKTELIQKIIDVDPALAGGPDPINRCRGKKCDFGNVGKVQRGVEQELHELAGTKGGWVAELPEISLLRIKMSSGDDLVYTLIHNRAHTNVAHMTREEARRIPDEDTVTIVRGYRGSYPNFLFEMPLGDVGSFVAALRGNTKSSGLPDSVERWGVRRSSPHFWQSLDWIQADFLRRQPLEAGLLDINRYQNL